MKKMRLWKVAAFSISQVLVLGISLTGNQAVIERRPIGDEWSPVVQGVRGRLIASATHGGPQRQLRLDLELENVSSVVNPISIWWSNWNGVLDLLLEVEGGTSGLSTTEFAALPRLAMGGNEIVAPGYWAPASVR